MRPLELTIEGFKSYRGAHTFNFEDRGMFGIVGPTGAGKSSILEALLFAFYGKTPRLERDTKKLINSEAEEAKVRLMFEVSEAVWTVTRVIRKKGAAVVVLESSDGSEGQVTGEKNVNERVAELLGLDFHSFCASISLPQGQFDHFLKATAKERTEILKGLFRLSRVDLLRESAKGRATLIKQQLQILAAELDRLPENPEKLIAELKEARVGAARRVDEIRETLPSVLKAESGLGSAKGELEAIAVRRRRIEAAYGSLPPEQQITDLVEASDAVARRLAEAETKSANALTKLQEATKAEQTLEQEGRGQAWCSEVEASIKEAHRLAEERATLSKELAGLETQVAKLKKQSNRDQGVEQDKRRTFMNCQAALRNAHRDHAAHALALGLAEGDACPVCRQTVAVLPELTEVPAVALAESELELAEKQLQEAKDALESSTRSQALAEQQHASSVSRLAQLEAQSKPAQARLEKLTGPGSDPAEALAAARRSIEQARLSIQSLFSEHTAVSEMERQLRGESHSLGRDLNQMSSKVVHVLGLLGGDAHVIEQEGIAAGAKQARDAVAVQLKELDTRILEIEASSQKARELLEEFHSRFGSADDMSSADVLAGAITTLDRIDRDIVETQAVIAKLEQGEAERARLKADGAIYDRLTSDLTDSKFTAYLLEGQRRQLSLLASEKLNELTGHYIFTEEGDFDVIDQRTGSARTPDTLSGGETFLASLSLALALSELVAQQGGRLGSFFLDEGFGSLDSESLDLALEGIESLATPGRLIGLISHVGGLQSRLDDLIVLEKNADGSTGVSQYEGPIAYLSSVI